MFQVPSTSQATMNNLPTMITLLDTSGRTTRSQAQRIKQKKPLKAHLEEEAGRLVRIEAHLLDIIKGQHAEISRLGESRI